jgi:HSP20 family protein
MGLLECQMGSLTNQTKKYMTKLLNGKHLPASRNDFLTPFDSMFDEMIGKAFPSFEKEFGVEFFGNNSYPKVDVIDTPESIEFEAEIPGLSKDEVSVEVEKGILSISGNKRSGSSSEDLTYIRKELKRSSFKRSFQLSNFLNAAKIEAKFENGLLLITVPKIKPEKPQKIKIL